MELGIKQAIKNGNGNTIIYTALLAAMAANFIPTPFDGIYFRRVNTLEHEYDEGKISAEKLEYHIAGEYYLWTAAWYGVLFLGIYSFGGEYKTNAKILLGLVGAGFVLGAVKKNIEINKQIKKQKNG